MTLSVDGIKKIPNTFTASVCLRFYVRFLLSVKSENCLTQGTEERSYKTQVRVHSAICLNRVSSRMQSTTNIKYTKIHLVMNSENHCLLKN